MNKPPPPESSNRSRKKAARIKSKIQEEATNQKAELNPKKENPFDIAGTSEMSLHSITKPRRFSDHADTPRGETRALPVKEAADEGKERSTSRDRSEEKEKRLPLKDYMTGEEEPSTSKKRKSSKKSKKRKRNSSKDGTEGSSLKNPANEAMKGTDKKRRARLSGSEEPLHDMETSVDEEHLSLAKDRSIHKKKRSSTGEPRKEHKSKKELSLAENLSINESSPTKEASEARRRSSTERKPSKERKKRSSTEEREGEEKRQHAKHRSTGSEEPSPVAGTSLRKEKEQRSSTGESRKKHKSKKESSPTKEESEERRRSSSVINKRSSTEGREEGEKRQHAKHRSTRSEQPSPVARTSLGNEKKPPKDFSKERTKRPSGIKSSKDRNMQMSTRELAKNAKKLSLERTPPKEKKKRSSSGDHSDEKRSSVKEPATESGEPSIGSETPKQEKKERVSKRDRSKESEKASPVKVENPNTESNNETVGSPDSLDSQQLTVRQPEPYAKSNKPQDTALDGNDVIKSLKKLEKTLKNQKQ